MAEPQRVATITVDLGVPHRLDVECPSCGWADLWRSALVRLTTAGVSTLGEVTSCQRCGHKLASKSRG